MATSTGEPEVGCPLKGSCNTRTIAGGVGHMFVNRLLADIYGIDLLSRALKADALVMRSSTLSLCSST
jgi:hypothetical protein